MAGPGLDEETGPAADTGAGEESGSGADGGLELDGSWLHGEELRSLRQSWRGIQVSFVDEPGKAVGDANTMVADLMRRLAQALFDERAALEMRYLGHDQVSTEELRQGLRRYRAIFDRLLTITW